MLGVPCVFPEICGLVICAGVCHRYLMEDIIVVGLELFLLLLFSQAGVLPWHAFRSYRHTLCYHLWRGYGLIRQTHIDSVEPYLIVVDLLVPVDALVCAWLVDKLAEECPQGDVISLAGGYLVHAVDEARRADIVEIEILVLEARCGSVISNHLLGVSLHIVEDVVTSMCKICVEHSLKLYAHDIRPFALGMFLGVGEVEVYGVGDPLHLGACQPLGVALVRHIGKHERAIDANIVKMNIVHAVLPDHRFVSHSCERAVAHMYVIDSISLLHSIYDNTMTGLSACDILHPYIVHIWYMSALSRLFGLVVDIYAQDSLTAFSDTDIAHENVLGDTSTTCVCLYAQYTVEIWGGHLAILSKDILNAS